MLYPSDDRERDVQSIEPGFEDFCEWLIDVMSNAELDGLRTAAEAEYTRGATLILNASPFEAALEYFMQLEWDR
jgi:hypothetical protein